MFYIPFPDFYFTSQPAITCSKLTLETLDQDVNFDVNFDVNKMLTPCSSVSIVNFGTYHHSISIWREDLEHGISKYNKEMI